jgi:aspartyl-tRNA(Asn)/glutamyl-tRNA(Gln) amidotransferase subunit A
MALKDLFDVKGDITPAGSRVLCNEEPAAKDGVAVARLRAAGFVFVGRTNMVEFAFGGLGPNPHYGTPLSVYDREAGRVPGGSSSGSAVAVADGMATIAMGTDTGGSCRIPAAFNGLTGYKPTASRISTEGVYPLSTTMDSVGPIGRSVQCCASVDSILAGNWSGELAPQTPGSLKLAVVKNFVLENLDDDVARVFGTTLGLLSSSGVSLTDITIPAIDDIPAANAAGGIAPAEAWALHRSRLETQANSYDPRVGFRIMMGQNQTAADYIDALQARKRISAEAHAVTRPFDAVLMPSVAIIPPKLTDIENDNDYFRLNMLSLRNTSVGYFLDR